VSNRKPAKSQKSSGPAAKVQARCVDGAWELAHPRCARVRAEDLEEVEQMIEAGELEIARDELLWLLQDCHDFIAAHCKLGELAIEAGDLKLARGHFGYGYQIGLKAIDASGPANQFSYSRGANQSFHESGKGLVYCLVQLGKRGVARDVAQRLLVLDPSDPLNIRDVLAGKTTPCQTPAEPPIVPLQMPPRKTDAPG
jgi:hypothetical protein